MSDSEDIVQTLINAIETDIRAHEEGDFENIATRYDDVLGKFLPFREKNDVVSIALDFWDCWGDASNHQWRHYDGIESYDWPKLAREIVASLRANEMPNNETIISNFTFQRKPSWLGRFKAYLGVQTDGNA